MKKHWRTSICGLAAIIAGVVLAGLGGFVCAKLYVPSNTLWFNLCYAISQGIALIVCAVVQIIAGLGLLHAADHKNTDSTKP